ncbi:hypothetical protein [Streptomyces sp. TS71-3]|uniref:hypothetical protein n=1 Tax=Streptomyces sp. TS71-3 TaxID=2733862 RepID=UPI001B242E39|nr:hypothetical protein [Streptomyces sp. TS71-3]GHJ41600.1 hypothetical protein Sm713_72090 [Streptomyces sp. TS71-3]
MRKLSAVVAALALAGLGAVVPAGTAQASTACDNAWAGATSGDFYAYSNANCSGFLGKAAGDDSNWGDGSGSFQGSDTNSASSVLTRGTSGLAVAVYNGTGTDWGGGYTCLRKSEYYASNLSDNKFTSGAGVDNAISSHRWASESACYGHWLT